MKAEHEFGLDDDDVPLDAVHEFTELFDNYVEILFDVQTREEVFSNLCGLLSTEEHWHCADSDVSEKLNLASPHIKAKFGAASTALVVSIKNMLRAVSQQHRCHPAALAKSSLSRR